MANSYRFIRGNSVLTVKSDLSMREALSEAIDLMVDLEETMDKNDMARFSNRCPRLSRYFGLSGKRSA